MAPPTRKVNKKFLFTVLHNLYFFVNIYFRRLRCTVILLTLSLPPCLIFWKSWHMKGDRRSGIAWKTTIPQSNAGWMSWSKSVSKNVIRPKLLFWASFRMPKSLRLCPLSSQSAFDRTQRVPSWLKPSRIQKMSTLQRHRQHKVCIRRLIDWLKLHLLRHTW